MSLKNRKVKDQREIVIGIGKEIDQKDNYYVFVTNNLESELLEDSINNSNKALDVAELYRDNLKLPIRSFTKDIVLKGMQTIRMN